MQQENRKKGADYVTAGQALIKEHDAERSRMSEWRGWCHGRPIDGRY